METQEEFDSGEMKYCDHCGGEVRQQMITMGDEYIIIDACQDCGCEQ